MTPLHNGRDEYVATVERKQLFVSLQWRHNERDGVSNQQPHECLLNPLLISVVVVVGFNH